MGLESRTRGVASGQGCSSNGPYPGRPVGQCPEKPLARRRGSQPGKTVGGAPAPVFLVVIDVVHQGTNRRIFAQPPGVGQGRASVFDLTDLTRESEHMLQEAKQHAQQIMRQAEQEAAKLVDSAIDRGFAEGKDQGLAQGREEGHQAGRAEAIAECTPQLKDLQASVTAAFEQWEADRHGMLLAAREDVLRLALAVAEKVTYRLIQTDSTVIGDQLAEALALLVAPRAVTVAVAPQDRALVESMLPELIDKINTCTHAAIRDDPSVTRGGCVISTGAGRIDATIERQIQRIVDTLLPPPVEADPANDTPGDDALAEEAQS